MKDILSAVATNLHIVVVSLLIVGLDLGVVRIGNTHSGQQPPTSVTLTTSSGGPNSPAPPRGNQASADTDSTILPGGVPAHPWRPPATHRLADL